MSEDDVDDDTTINPRGDHGFSGSVVVLVVACAVVGVLEAYAAA
jgi:hypothetical protein